jgi:hypothetical protein
VASRVAASPDGRKWEVSVHRVRLPGWHHSRFEPNEDADLLVLAFEYLVLAPLFWFVFPLVRAVVLIPIALARTLVSSTRRVEAVCLDPAEIRILWRTRRGAASQVAGEITRRLSRGYEDLTPREAEFITMTEPPGCGDLNA